MERKRVSSGAPWEPTLGYCRAVKAGSHVYISGTVAIDRDGNLVGRGEPYLQALHIFSIMSEALAELGGTLADVVRTRVYLANFKDLDEVARAHRETFGAHPPANTVLEISQLIDPAMRVEIEADAVIG